MCQAQNQEEYVQTGRMYHQHCKGRSQKKDLQCSKGGKADCCAINLPQRIGTLSLGILCVVYVET